MKLFNNVCDTEDHGNETVPPHSTCSVNIVQPSIYSSVSHRHQDSKTSVATTGFSIRMKGLLCSCETEFHRAALYIQQALPGLLMSHGDRRVAGQG